MLYLHNRLLNFFDRQTAQENLAPHLSSKLLPEFMLTKHFSGITHKLELRDGQHSLSH